VAGCCAVSSDNDRCLSDRRHSVTIVNPPNEIVGLTYDTQLDQFFLGAIKRFAGTLVVATVGQAVTVARGSPRLYCDHGASGVILPDYPLTVLSDGL
jgi:hypothetical protein